MTNYQTFRAKIRAASPADCGKLLVQLERLWQAGVFTASEFQRLDLAICDLSISAAYKTA